MNCRPFLIKLVVYNDQILSLSILTLLYFWWWWREPVKIHAMKKLFAPQIDSLNTIRESFPQAVVFRNYIVAPHMNKTSAEVLRKVSLGIICEDIYNVTECIQEAQEWPGPVNMVVHMPSLEWLYTYTNYISLDIQGNTNVYLHGVSTNTDSINMKDSQVSDIPVDRSLLNEVLYRSSFQDVMYVVDSIPNRDLFIPLSEYVDSMMEALMRKRMFITFQDGLLVYSRNQYYPAFNSATMSLVNDIRIALLDAGYREWPPGDDTSRLIGCIEEERYDEIIKGIDVTNFYVMDRESWCSDRYTIAELVHVPNFIIPRVLPKYEDITVFTQLDIRKLQRLSYIASSWGGWISTAIYISIDEMEEFITHLQANLEIYSRTSFHILIKDSSGPHPVNLARNISMYYVITAYMLALDVDFIPSKGLYDRLMGLFSREPWHTRIQTELHAFVVPAFEEQEEDTGVVVSDEERFNRLPLTKEALKQHGNIHMFHSYFGIGHRSTNYNAWWSSDDDTEPYSISTKWQYEPYIVIETGYNFMYPKFDSAFVGFGFNKATWVFELMCQGYKFEVIPGEFVIHIYHADGRGRVVDREIHSIAKMFKNYIRDLYPVGDKRAADHVSRKGVACKF